MQAYRKRSVSIACTSACWCNNYSCGIFLHRRQTDAHLSRTPQMAASSTRISNISRTYWTVAFVFLHCRISNTYVVPKLTLWNVCRLTKKIILEPREPVFFLFSVFAFWVFADTKTLKRQQCLYYRHFSASEVTTLRRYTNLFIIIIIIIIIIPVFG